MLENKPYAAVTGLLVGNIFALKKHFAAVREFEPRDNTQERGFSGTRRSKQGNQLARFHFQADFFQRGEISKLFGQCLNINAHDSAFSAAASLAASRCVCHSIRFFAIRVKIAKNISRDATAKAGANLYSL